MDPFYSAIDNRDCFGELPSYGRFVALMPRLPAPFCVLIHNLSGQETGVYIADSTRPAVCANPRISRNRTFKGLAARGHSTMGWFFGFKLHVVMNHRGELMAVKITPGNTDDRAPLTEMVTGLEGNLLADKGCISKKPFAKLWKQGLHPITGIRRNMKNCLMPIMDKPLLRSRFIVETLFGKLKSEMGLEHTRHRSPTNAFVHILSCLVVNQTGFTGEHKAWKVGYDQRKFRKPIFDRGAIACAFRGSPPGYYASASAT